MAHDELYHRHAQLATQQHKRGAVADVLLESAHVGGQRLVCIVFRLIYPNVAVELGIDPVIHATHVVHEARGACVGGGGQTHREGHILVQFERVTCIQAHHQQILRFPFRPLVVFGENFHLGAAPQVGI